MSRFNLEAFTNPLPAVDTNQPPLIPDDVQWDIMTRAGTTVVDPRVRISRWSEEVRESNPEDVMSNGIVETREARLFYSDTRIILECYVEPGRISPLPSLSAQQPHGECFFINQDLPTAYWNTSQGSKDGTESIGRLLRCVEARHMPCFMSLDAMSSHHNSCLHCRLHWPMLLRRM
jgi:hypothetical protein